MILATDWTAAWLMTGVGVGVVFAILIILVLVLQIFDEERCGHRGTAEASGRCLGC